MSSFEGRLLGRAAELAELSRLAESTLAGTGQAAFVVGEAGLGKTAVLEQAAADARRRGMQVLSASARNLPQPCPFAVISDCLRLEESPSDARREQAAEVLRGDARYGVAGAGSEAAGADAATIEAMVGLVEDLCAQRPLALFLDDLQWADPASLAVLHKLVRSVHQLPLLVVGAHRPVPEAGDVVARLSGGTIAGNRTLLELAPLEPAAVAALLADRCGREAGPRLRRMAEGAAGNPLYLTELVAALRREHAIEAGGATAEVSAHCALPTLTALVTHRLRDLREEVLQMLRIVAVLGAGCTTAELATVIDTPLRDLLTAMAEAEASGILRDTGQHLRFRHELIRKTLYDAVPVSVRAMLHTKAAQRLAQAGATPERVAEHLLNGVPSPEFLITWLQGSAARLTTRAPAMALRLLTTALEVGDPADAGYGNLRFHHAVAQLSCGRLAEAEESARSALAKAEFGLESVLRWIVIQAAFARGRPDLALAEARAGCRSAGVEAVERVQFQAFSAVCLFALGDLTEAGATASRARSAADEVGDSSALASSLHVLAAKRFIETPDAEAVELARHASRLTPDTLHPAQWLGLQLALVNCYIDLDLGPDAQRTLAAVRRPAERIGGVFLPWYHLSCALLAFHTGRWDDALAEIEAGLDCGDQAAMSRALRAMATVIAVHRGRRPLAEARLTAVLPELGNATVAAFYEYLPMCAGALLDEARGDDRRAYSRLAEAFDEGVGHLPGQLILGFLTPDLVRLALAQGDHDSARCYAAAAQRRAEDSGGLYHLGDAYRCEGLLNADPDLLMEASRCYRNAPRPLNAAHACTDAAEALARRGRLDDARVLLDQALETFTQLGAVWDAAQATSRLRSVAVRRGSHRPRIGARDGWQALTHTERLVAEHVAEGCSNPEIAARLSIARSTVSTHVSSILRKLAMTSRVEIAAEVTRRQRAGRSPSRD
ncbi:helix-turn-helix transcriptional regulator [Streptomyces lydicus]|uniref:HTH luxR-type domain-containing protein n=1 Tax=Streptomyces lydicus TaxID=47763 RepID=A0A1D7VQK3_9ACTN|nr:AAA family ATPase [Streptomyces lydicus]AOP49011.1 hypothetical protein SL103_24645 [Streptomyces lydicus]